MKLFQEKREKLIMYKHEQMFFRMIVSNWCDAFWGSNPQIIKSSGDPA